MNDPRSAPTGEVLIRPVSRGPASGDTPAKGPGKQRLVAIAVAAAVVLVGTVVALVVAFGSGEGDGTADVAGEQTATDAGGNTGATLDFDTSVSTTAPAGDPAAAAPGDPTAGGDPAAGTAPAPGADGTGSGVAILVPRPGSYTYTGTGSVRMTPFLPTPVPQGPTKPATVTHTGGGCWRLDIKQNANQADAATFCAGADGSLVLRSLAVQQINDLGRLGGLIKSDLATSCPTPVTIVAPGMVPGATFPLTCTNHTEMTPRVMAPVADSTASGSITFVGVEAVDVGGAPVAAYHLHQQVQLTPSDGAPPGSRVADLWIATDDGMVLREVRSMTASAKLFGQVSTYSETSEHTLTSR